VGLYEEPERPTSPMDYIKRYIGAPKNIDVDGLKRENEQLRRQLAVLTSLQGATTTANANANTTTTTTSNQKASAGVDGGEKTNTTTTTSDNNKKKT
ncbi:MAG: hypothetical protein ACI8RD_011818, partial [Bacillariaceae sp.]|jgi:hypothetical protein